MPSLPVSQEDRAWRQRTVQHELSDLNLDPEEQAQVIEQHQASETAHLRATRQRLCLGARACHPLGTLIFLSFAVFQYARLIPQIYPSPTFPFGIYTVAAHLRATRQKLCLGALSRIAI
jgi:hypothetical protein